MEDENVQDQGGAQDGDGQQGAAEGQGTETQNSDASKATEAETKAAAEKAAAEENAKEPQVRKTKLEYILERKNKQNEKLKAQVDNKGGSGAGDGGGKAGKEDLEAADEAKFEKYLHKRFGDKLEMVDVLAEGNAEADIKSDVNEYLGSTEGKYFKDHAEKIHRWAKDPSRKNVPIATIAMEAVGITGLLKIGAAMQKDADNAAKHSQAGGGSSTRKTDNGGQKSVKDMTDAEFQARKLKVLQKAG